MAPLREVFGDHIATALAAPTGGFCHDLLVAAAAKGSPTSTSGSTRASSPGCESSTSDGISIPSPEGKPQLSDSLAHRRGLRAAILNDLGVDVDAVVVANTPASADSCSVTPSMSPPSRISQSASPSISTGCAISPQQRLIGTCPAPGPRAPAADASQRRPCVPQCAAQITGTQSPACKGNTPTVNSRLSRNLLCSSPGSPCDASQRSVTRFGSVAALGASSWGSAVTSIESTRAAAMANSVGTLSSSPLSSPLPCGMAFGAIAMVPIAQTASVFPTSAIVQPAPGSVPRSPTSQDGYVPTIVKSAIASGTDVPASTRFGANAVLNELFFGQSGLAALSNDDLDARLRAAAPEEYED